MSDFLPPYALLLCSMDIAKKQIEWDLYSMEYKSKIRHHVTVSWWAQGASLNQLYDLTLSPEWVKTAVTYTNLYIKWAIRYEQIYECTKYRCINRLFTEVVGGWRRKMIARHTFKQMLAISRFIRPIKLLNWHFDFVLYSIQTHNQSVRCIQNK